MYVLAQLNNVRVGSNNVNIYNSDWKVILITKRSTNGFLNFISEVVYKQVKNPTVINTNRSFTAICYIALNAIWATNAYNAFCI